MEPTKAFPLSNCFVRCKGSEVFESWAGSSPLHACEQALRAVTTEHPYKEGEDLKAYADRLADDACSLVESVAAQEHLRVTKRGGAFGCGGPKTVHT
jgi:hypothetical protein